MRPGVCHVFPFYVEEQARFDICPDPRAEELVVRGTLCKREAFEPAAPVYDGGQLVADKIFCWVPAGTASAMQRGLELMKEGIGLKEAATQRVVGSPFKHARAFSKSRSSC
ncbi:hypothetical protein PAPHI01_1501 [Pancytospora philotis]|nr:hypothetical protein PAPHI01_1501 [Pancytospora philotis]